MRGMFLGLRNVFIVRKYAFVGGRLPQKLDPVSLESADEAMQHMRNMLEASKLCN